MAFDTRTYVSIDNGGPTTCNEGHDLAGANACELPSGEVMCRKCRGIAQRSYGVEWANGRGQVFVFLPDHPRARKDGFYSKAKLVMELHLGRYLDPEERVLHLDGVDNDEIENLKLFPSQHALLLHKAEQFNHTKKTAGLFAALTPAQREAMEVRRLEAENNRRLEREEAAEKARLDALRKANERRQAEKAKREAERKSINAFVDTPRYGHEEGQDPDEPEPEPLKLEKVEHDYVKEPKKPVKHISRKPTNEFTTAKSKKRK